MESLLIISFVQCHGALYIALTAVGGVTLFHWYRMLEIVGETFGSDEKVWKYGHV